MCKVPGTTAGRAAQAATGDMGKNWEEAGSLGKDTVVYSSSLVWFRVLAAFPHLRLSGVPFFKIMFYEFICIWDRQ